MLTQQLELNLWQALEAAAQAPDTANLQGLCDALEQTLTQQPLAQQLAIAGEGLVQLCAVYAARADLLIAQWEYRHNPKEPAVSLDGCVDLFVQSLSLDVTDLFEEPEPVQYPANRKRQPVEGTIVGEVDKDVLLTWVDETVAEQPMDESQIARQIQELAHGENVEVWVRAIAQYLQGVGSGIRLPELQQGVGMPTVELWLGLLLGGYGLEQQGDFYDGTTIWVKG
jgi:hypothetical protein